MASTNLHREFISQSILRINENIPRVEKCYALLSEEQLWLSPNAHSNSVANLTLHLCGNMTQYVLSALGGREDKRERDLEFSARNTHHKEQLIQKLKTTVQDVVETIAQCPESKLLELKHVQGFHYTGAGIIIHVTEHFSYHTGQIALLSKLITNQNLGFYAGINLNIKNSGEKA
jgi:uncharacterized damage-inducible protein DinB